MGLHFHKSLLEWVACTFSGFSGPENSGMWEFKNSKMFKKCVGSFQDDLVKRLYKVDA